MHQGIDFVKRTAPYGPARRSLLLGCLAALATAAFAAPGAAAAAPCPNEALRAESPQLADCRAYEMVSPVDMNGNGVEGAFAVSPDGDAIAYGTINVFAEAPSSIAGKWIARRGTGEWSSATINPPTPGRVPSAYDEPVALGFSTDLSSALIGSRYPFDPLDQAPYRNTSASGDADVFRVWPGGRAEWLTHGPALPDTAYIESALSGASADLSRVFFQTREDLAPEAEGSTAQNLYERDGDELRVVNVDDSGHLMPGGAAVGRGASVAGAFYSGESEYVEGRSNQGRPLDSSAVSSDGSHVFFTSPLDPSVGKSQLYVQIDGSHTELVSACEFGACKDEGAPAGALFLFARSDGSAVTFYSADQLIESAPPGGGIYRFDVGSGTLTFLTTLDTATEGGSHHGGLLAATEDGSYLYLCEGGKELAVFHAGTRKTIAAIPCNASGATSAAAEPTGSREGFAPLGVPGITQGEPTITPDAGYLFATAAGPAALGNAYPNEGHTEVYFYEAATSTLRCLSCRADGTPAEADSFLNQASMRPQPGFRIFTPAESGVPVRSLSASGTRAFFVSEEELVPGDVDHRQDVYEWEAAGSGSCTTDSAGYAAAAAGCISLISPGDSPQGAVFEGASENGDDVFFTSFESLVPADTGSELQLYDARVDGGLAGQHEVQPAPCGETDACRGAGPGAPASTPADTARYSGPGNPRPAADCAAPRKRANALRAKAKAARRAARRARVHDQKGKARRMESKARGLAKGAERLSKQAKRCTKGNRRASK